MLSDNQKKNKIVSKIKSHWYDLGVFPKTVKVMKYDGHMLFFTKRDELIGKWTYDIDVFNLVLKWCINQKINVDFINQNEIIWADVVETEVVEMSEYL